MTKTEVKSEETYEVSHEVKIVNGQTDYAIWLVRRNNDSAAWPNSICVRSRAGLLDLYTKIGKALSEDCNSTP